MTAMKKPRKRMRPVRAWGVFCKDVLTSVCLVRAEADKRLVFWAGHSPSIRPVEIREVSRGKR